MLVHAFRWLATPRTPCCVGANLVLRLQCKAAFGVGAVVDARLVAVRGQAGVGHLRPELAPGLGVGAGIPGALLQSEAFQPGLAQGQQYLGVWLGLPVFRKRCSEALADVTAALLRPASAPSARA